MSVLLELLLEPAVDLTKGDRDRQRQREESFGLQRRELQAVCCVPLALGSGVPSSGGDEAGKREKNDRTGNLVVQTPWITE